MVQQTLQDAARAFRDGKLDMAERLYRDAICKNDTVFQAWEGLGVVQYSRGENETARKSLKRSLSLECSNPASWFNLGNVERRLHQFQAALDAYQRAIDLNPRFFQAYNGKANVFSDTGHDQQAADMLGRAIEINPDFAGAYINLGNILLRQHLANDAMRCFETAGKIQPGFPGASLGMGRVCRQLLEFGAAERYFREALSLAPDEAAINVDLALVLWDQGDVEQAKGRFEAAVALDPDLVRAYAGMADLLEHVNRLDQSLSWVNRGLALDPADPLLQCIHAKCLRRQGDINQASQILANIDRRRADSDVLAKVCYEQGRNEDSLENYDAAYRHFQEANATLKQGWDVAHPEKNGYLLEQQRLGEFFASKRNTDAAPRTLSRFSPVFLVGFPRSGTTLLDQVLDAHPQIEVVEERPMLSRAKARLLEMGLEYPAGLAQLCDAQRSDLTHTYVNALPDRRMADGEALVIDKMPLNLGDIPLIHALFPESKMILALRHPCDVVLSCFCQEFTINTAMANFFSLDSSARLYNLLMANFQQYRSQFDLTLYSSRYEDLIQDLPGHAHGLLDFLGLAWDDRVTDPAGHASKKSYINTPSYHQVSQPIYQSSRQKWLRYKPFFEPVRSLLEPHVDRFGYQW